MVFSELAPVRENPRRGLSFPGHRSDGVGGLNTLMNQPLQQADVKWWDAIPNHPEFHRDSFGVSNADEGTWAILESEVKTGLVAQSHLPATAQMCLDALRRPESAPADLAAIFARNPAFGERVLALAQVAKWWPQAGNGAEALSAIGTRRLRILTYAAALATVFSERFGRDAQPYIQQAVATATACHHVATRLNLDADDAWLAGFFHDAGAACVDEAAAQLESRGWPLTHKAHFKAWKARLHSIAGAELTLAWDLPDDVVDGASHHFEKSGPLTSEMALVALGTRIATRLRGREEDDGGMVVTESVTRGLRRDRLTLLATLTGVELAIDRACDLVS